MNKLVHYKLQNNIATIRIDDGKRNALSPAVLPEPDRGVNLGLSHLRKYKRRFNESLGVFLGPLKDGNDHAADAFGEYAINCRISASKPQTPEPPKQQQSQVVLEGPPKERSKKRIRV